MTPIGHTAAGYATAYATLKIAEPSLPQAQINWLVFWGIFWAVIIDWDLVIAFAMNKSAKLDKGVSHRRFPSHAPLPWILASGFVYFLTSSSYGHYFALLMFLGSMSHMICDSIEYGIMWGWPFNKKLYAICLGPIINLPEDNSLIRSYWNRFLAYMQTRTFKFEAAAWFAGIALFLTKI